MVVRLNILGIVLNREKLINTKFKRHRISREKVKKKFVFIYEN